MPLIASNMDTVGTFEMAEALAKHGCYTCIHKYKTLKEWRDFAKRCPEALPYTAASSGTADDDFERLNQVLQAIPREWLSAKSISKSCFLSNISLLH